MAYGYVRNALKKKKQNGISKLILYSSIMLICGIDWSKNSPAITYMELNDDFRTIGIYFHSVSKVKKIQFREDSICVFYEPKKIQNDVEKAVMLRDILLPDDKKIDYAAIENYAYGAKGQVFDIAESAMTAKLKLYEHHKAKLRIYDIGVHKKAFSERGDSDKVSMFNAYNRFYPNDPLKLNHFKLPEPVKKEGVSPTSDIIDSFSVCELLRIELTVRAGLIQLNELPERIRQAFLYTSKSQPLNLLTTDFLCK